MTTITILHANLKAGRYDYGKSWPKRRRAKFLAYVKAHRPMVLTLVEAERPACQSLAVALGMSCCAFRGSAILWDPSRLTRTKTLAIRAWLSGSHTQSLVLAEFKVLATGERFNLAASHLPPFVTRAALRKRQMTTLTALTAGYHDPTIVCTDANWSRTCESYMQARGWRSARKTATAKVNAGFATSGTKFKAGNPIDYAFLRHGATAALYAVRDGRSWSDHNALELAVTL